jgi:hypothetical protein
MPANAGIQLSGGLDSRFRGNDERQFESKGELSGWMEPNQIAIVVGRS